jgi:hypothetical protein
MPRITGIEATKLDDVAPIYFSLFFAIESSHCNHDDEIESSLEFHVCEEISELRKLKHDLHKLINAMSDVGI